MKDWPETGPPPIKSGRNCSIRTAVREVNNWTLVLTILLYCSSLAISRRVGNRRFGESFPRMSRPAAYALEDWAFMHF